MISKTARRLAAGLLVVATFPGPAQALAGQAKAVHVTTQHNDNSRTGANLDETILTPANVNEAMFGKVFTMPVDGNVYAQPLYLSGVMIGGTARNVLYVATEHDSVFAFDADKGVPAWPAPVSFLGPGVTPVPAKGFVGNPIGNVDITPEVGITGTPVIALDPTNPAASTLYVVAKTQEVAGGVTSFVHRLHALDVTNGAEKFGGPVVLDGSYPGTGNGSDDPADVGKPGNSDGHGNLLFAPPGINGSLRANQRSGLLLHEGVVYAGFASHGDKVPYSGWLLGRDAGDLRPRSVFNTTPDGGRGAIWQSGAGPASEPGSIYFATGNGTFDAAKPDAQKANFGDSLLRLTVALGTPLDKLAVADFFTPHDQADFQKRDLDFGSGGVLLLPDVPGVHPPYAVVAGKSGVIFLIDRKKFGGFDPAADHVAQRIPAKFTDPPPIGLVYGMAAYFDGSVYFLGVNDLRFDSLKQFKFAGGRLPEVATSRSTHRFTNRSSTPSISANGNKDAIVWIIESGGYRPVIPATLHAFDARDLAVELYNSDTAVTYPNPHQLAVAKRDQPGIGLKFTVPTIANGRVYVGTAGEVTAYGLLP